MGFKGLTPVGRIVRARTVPRRCYEFSPATPMYSTSVATFLASKCCDSPRSSSSSSRGSSRRRRESFSAAEAGTCFASSVFPCYGEVAMDHSRPPSPAFRPHMTSRGSRCSLYRGEGVDVARRRSPVGMRLLILFFMPLFASRGRDGLHLRKRLLSVRRNMHGGEMKGL